MSALGAQRKLGSEVEIFRFAPIAAIPSRRSSDRVRPIVLKKSGLSSFSVVWTGSRRYGGERRVGSDRCGRRGNRKQLGKFTEVLSGGGEMELVAGAAWPT